MNNVSFTDFRRDAVRALEDPNLQRALEGATFNFQVARTRALAEFPGVDRLRDRLKAIRSATLARLADHLETFERQAIEAGAQVHWARNAEEASRIVYEIANRHGAKTAVKSKSMATEEIHLNDVLERGGIKAVETDLGEWIIQLAGEPPSHIIAPAIHKTRQQVAELFTKEAGYTLGADDIQELTREARRLLRERFLEAGIGITGANMGVAESGSVVLVTNEGNGRLVTSVPPVHVAVMGIEKVVPTWRDAAVWLALLARSATGQPMSIYTTAITGPARPSDPDGPQEVHIVLLDNGRSEQVGTSYEEVLQCIRCGACLNVCPVYREVGGHTYGSPYSGPIGAVLTPLLYGLEAYEALPYASSLCGACLEVCPVRIDLPRMLLELRAEEVDEKIVSPVERVAERTAAFVLAHPTLFRLVSRLMRLAQRPLTREGSLQLPAALNPAGERRLPALAPRSFREMWAAGEIDQPGEEGWR